jgi:hypothetical protein
MSHVVRPLDAVHMTAGHNALTKARIRPCCGKSDTSCISCGRSACRERGCINPTSYPLWLFGTSGASICLSFYLVTALSGLDSRGLVCEKSCIGTGASRRFAELGWLFRRQGQSSAARCYQGLTTLRFKIPVGLGSAVACNSDAEVACAQASYLSCCRRDHHA